MKGIVFDIQRFCVNDGPGIRSTVFLKGCPLSCLWCHNPESKKQNPQLSYKEDTCIKCGVCVDVCKKNVHSFDDKIHKVDYKKCTGCGKCSKKCRSNSLFIYGKEMNAKDIITVISSDKKYYKTSGGGLTISGGEPLMQSDFVLEIAKRAKEEGIHVAIETSGQGNTEKLEKLFEFVDLFLLDYKATGEEKHKDLIGVSNQKIEENRKKILESGKKVILRCPIIPNYNLSDDHLRAIAVIVKSTNNIIRTEVLPYHPLGESKSMQIGETYQIKNTKMLSDEDVVNIISKLKEYGVKEICKG